MNYKILQEKYTGILKEGSSILPDNTDIESEAVKILRHVEKLPEGDLFLKNLADELEDFYLDDTRNRILDVFKNKILTYIEVSIENIYYEQGERNIYGAYEQALAEFEERYDKWYKEKLAKDEFYKNNPGVNIDI